MNRFFVVEKEGYFFIGLLSLIVGLFMYLSFDGYKLFNGANTSKYDPKKEHHYHK